MTRNSNAPQLRWTALVPEGAADVDLTKGLCRKFDPEAWFPEPAHWKNGTAQEAVAVCYECPVRLECLAYALSMERNADGSPCAATLRYGIYGGHSAAERARLANGQPASIRRESCRNGHRYTPETTRIRTYSDGSTSRVCLTCEQANLARRRKRSAA